jgi:hypothetical protein
MSAFDPKRKKEIRPHKAASVFEGMRAALVLASEFVASLSF